MESSTTVSGAAAPHDPAPPTALIEPLAPLRGQTVVVKYGGSAMLEERAAEEWAHNLALLDRLGARPTVVHGGGPELSELMGRLGMRSSWVHGHRVTSEEGAALAEMVLSGRVNKRLVARLNRAGLRAVGLSGTDAGLLRIGRHRPEGRDIGFVGAVEWVDVSLLATLQQAGYLPVLSSTASDAEGRPHNINADWVAGAVAAALGARCLVFLTDVPGVRADGRVEPVLTVSAARDLIERGVACGGMRPKLEAALAAVEAGVGEVRLGDGTAPHALLAALGNGGSGTRLLPDGVRE